jgi:hypothetical protein
MNPPQSICDPGRTVDERVAVAPQVPLILLQLSSSITPAPDPALRPRDDAGSRRIILRTLVNTGVAPYPSCMYPDHVRTFGEPPEHAIETDTGVTSTWGSSSRTDEIVVACRRPRRSGVMR